MSINLIKLCGFAQALIERGCDMKQLQLALKTNYPNFDFKLVDNALIGIHGVFNKLRPQSYSLYISSNEILLKEKSNHIYSTLLKVKDGILCNN
jgi:hypothetical protein